MVCICIFVFSKTEAEFREILYECHTIQVLKMCTMRDI
jgi:hypothetical protein